jgi:hypothetical protein
MPNFTLKPLATIDHRMSDYSTHPLIQLSNSIRMIIAQPSIVEPRQQRNLECVLV